jgi:hypothetical protein
MNNIQLSRIRAMARASKVSHPPLILSRVVRTSDGGVCVNYSDASGNDRWIEIIERGDYWRIKKPENIIEDLSSLIGD